MRSKIKPSEIVLREPIMSFEKFNWKGALAGFMLLFSSCDNVTIRNKQGENITKTRDIISTGIITDITKIPMGNSGTQYQITIKEDGTGNTISIEKYAMNPFPDDETPSTWWMSNLKEGSKVKVVCGSDCKVYLKK